VITAAWTVNLEEMPCAVRDSRDNESSFRHLLEPHAGGILPCDYTSSIRQKR
jgi:hypothetical protein